jgi:hypothetical protein
MVNNQIKKIGISVVVCSKSAKNISIDLTLQLINNQMTNIDEFIFVENYIECKKYSKILLMNLMNKTKNIKYIPIKAQYVGESRELANKYASKDIIMSIDDDVLINPKLFNRVRYFFRLHPETVAYVNLFEPVARNPWSIVACAFWNQSLQFRTEPVKIKLYNMACSAFKRNFLRKHQLSFNMNITTGEDVDFMLQIVEREGVIFFDPYIINKHKFSLTMKQFIYKHYMYARNFIDMTYLHPLTYPEFENIYSYIPNFFDIPIIKYVVIMKKILVKTILFMKITKLKLRYTFYVLVMMTSMCMGVYNTRNKLSHD